MLGARMLEIYPRVPPTHNQALGLALFSFDGGLFRGFQADGDGLIRLRHGSGPE